MRIAVVSDTHMPRFGKQLPAALRRGLSDPPVDLILHLGDFTEPEVVPLFSAIAPFDAVAGNNDPPELHARFGRRKVRTEQGVRLGMVHGDGLGRSTVDRAIAAFLDDPVDVILFGHSHASLCERRQGVWLLNPGSATDKRRESCYSYGLLEVSAGQVAPRLVFYADRQE